MKIAILSGKGGTGKTTVAASMAKVKKICQYVDSDVEEPNGYLFLKPENLISASVNVLNPVVNAKLCTGCGDCARACQFNAIAVVKGKVLIFPEICHHCGACVLACKPGAVYEEERSIGVIERNRDLTFVQGRLNVGEPVAVPLISKLQDYIFENIPVIVDCPPGASCTVVKSVESCEYCILVTEPTPFGLHDLKIAVSLIRKFDKPFGVIINKATGTKTDIHDFCFKENIEILMEIPFSSKIAKDYSNGILPVDTDKSLESKFFNLFDKIKEHTAK